MDRTIWKYDIEPMVGVCELSMPKGAEILTVAEQNGRVRLWALVDVPEESHG